MKEKLNSVIVVWPLSAVDTVCFLLSLSAYKNWVEHANGRKQEVIQTLAIFIS